MTLSYVNISSGGDDELLRVHAIDLGDLSHGECCLGSPR